MGLLNGKEEFYRYGYFRVDPVEQIETTEEIGSHYLLSERQ